MATGSPSSRSSRCTTRLPGCVPATRPDASSPRGPCRGSLAGLGDSLDRIADDAEHEAIDVEALRRTADRAYEQGLAALQDELRHGRFLREEALRHWQAYVGADQVTRFFSAGHRSRARRDRGGLPAGDRPGRRGPRGDDRRPARGRAAPGGRGGAQDGDGLGGRAEHGDGHGGARRPVAPLPCLRRPTPRRPRRLDRWHRRRDPGARRVEAVARPGRVRRRQRARHRRDARHVPAHRRPDRRRGGRRGSDGIPQPEAAVGAVRRGGDGRVDRSTLDSGCRRCWKPRSRPNERGSTRTCPRPGSSRTLRSDLRVAAARFGRSRPSRHDLDRRPHRCAGGAPPRRRRAWRRPAGAAASRPRSMRPTPPISSAWTANPCGRPMRPAPAVSASPATPTSWPSSAGRASASRACSTRSPAATSARRRPVARRPPSRSPGSRARSGTTLAPLLEWLEVQETREHAPTGLGPVAILDLPDMDSVASEHRARVEALLPLVDAVAWVADPEKYADAVLHDELPAVVAAAPRSTGRAREQVRPPVRGRCAARPARPRGRPCLGGRPRVGGRRPPDRARHRPTGSAISARGSPPVRRRSSWCEGGSRHRSPRTSGISPGRRETARRHGTTAARRRRPATAAIRSATEAVLPRRRPARPRSPGGRGHAGRGPVARHRTTGARDVVHLSGIRPPDGGRRPASVPPPLARARRRARPGGRGHSRSVLRRRSGRATGTPAGAGGHARPGRGAGRARAARSIAPSPAWARSSHRRVAGGPCSASSRPWPRSASRCRLPGSSSGSSSGPVTGSVELPLVRSRSPRRSWLSSGSCWRATSSRGCSAPTRAGSGNAGARGYGSVWPRRSSWRSGNRAFRRVDALDGARRRLAAVVANIEQSCSKRDDQPR